MKIGCGNWVNPSNEEGPFPILLGLVLVQVEKTSFPSERSTFLFSNEIWHHFQTKVPKGFERLERYDTYEQPKRTFWFGGRK